MAQTIKIKRSSSNSTPTSLASGELAYSFKSDSKKLFIGDASNNVLVIGGQAFTDKLDLIGSSNGSTAADTRVVASGSNLGVIRIGTGLSIASNGVVSADEVDATSVSNAGAVMKTGSTMGSSSTFHFPTGSKITMGDTDSVGGNKNFEISASGGSSGARNILLQENGGGSLTIQGESLFLMHADGNDAVELLSVGSDTVTRFRSNGSEVARFKSGEFAVHSSAKITVDDIHESTSAHGVVIDGVTLKDGGITLGGDISFGDTNKAVFGASSDLKIFHGTEDINGVDIEGSYIIENGTGNLIMQGSNLEIRSTTDELYAQFVQDGVSKLYCNNDQKLSTKSDGVLITGELQSDTLDVNGNADISGDLILGGDLKITGDINQQNVNVTDLDVTDKTITVGVGQLAADSSNSGITVAGADAKIVYEYDTSTSSGKFEIDQGAGTQSAILTAANWGTEYTGAVDGGTF
tara:strand:+ start:12305 stop:13699 length:1395 start_codon:yes stop_codon:yes gene_type:complete